MILRAKQIFDKVYLDRPEPSDFIEFVAQSIKRELVNKLIDALEDDKLYIIQLSKPEIHEETYFNEMGYRQNLFHEELVQCKNCRRNFLGVINLETNLVIMDSVRMEGS